MPESNTDRIHKEITLRSPRSRVWQAITDSAQFGEWFGARLEGPFEVGKKIQGQSTNPGYEHLAFEVMVEHMEPEHSFALRWHPQAVDPEIDYSNEPTTLVEFTLEETRDGTRLTLTESGFDALPEEQRREAFPRNDGGWTEQMKNIQRHVDG